MSLFWNPNNFLSTGHIHCSKKKKERKKEKKAKSFKAARKKKKITQVKFSHEVTNINDINCFLSFNTVIHTHTQKNVNSSYLFASTEKREACRDHVLNQLRDVFGGTFNQSLFFFLKQYWKINCVRPGQYVPPRHSMLLLICVIAQKLWAQTFYNDFLMMFWPQILSCGCKGNKLKKYFKLLNSEWAQYNQPWMLQLSLEPSAWSTYTVIPGNYHHYPGMESGNIFTYQPLLLTSI